MHTRGSRSRTPRRSRGLASVVLSAMLVCAAGGCHDTEISGDAPRTFIPAFEVRKSFTRSSTSQKAAFFNIARYTSDADATVTVSPLFSPSERDVSGTITGAVVRAGVEFSYVGGPDDRYELATALGVLYAWQDYEYTDAGVPAHEGTGGVAPVLVINDGSVLLRSRLLDSLSFCVGLHAGGGDNASILESWVAAEYGIGEHALLTVGWRDMSVTTEEEAKNTALIFRVSGPTLGLRISF